YLILHSSPPFFVHFLRFPPSRAAPSPQLGPLKAMRDRKKGHDQFRDLFKTGSKEQTTARIAGDQQGRSRPSSNTGNQQQSRERASRSVNRSSKSVKKMSGDKRKKGTAIPYQQTTPNEETSNRRVLSPHARAPETPVSEPQLATPVAAPRTGNSKAVAPKKKSTPKKEASAAEETDDSQLGLIPTPLTNVYLDICQGINEKQYQSSSNVSKLPNMEWVATRKGPVEISE
ncbi:hypothetical protein PMAYCL1PPCAC_09808, partial [Pristionchus mayeri]